MTSCRCEAKRVAINGLLVLLLLLFSTVGSAAGLWDYVRKSHYQLFPEVNGTLTLSGVPMEGLTVIQEAHLDDTAVRETKTDEDGRFSFSEWEIYSRHPGLPLSEIRLFQTITVEYHGEQYLLWYRVTGGFKGAEKITELMREMLCDLLAPEAQQRFPNIEHPRFDHGIFSICRWPDKVSDLRIRNDSD